MINVVLFIHTWDIGGQGWRIKRAFDRYQPDFAVRSVHGDESYFKYPAGSSPYRATEAYGLFAQADVVHMRNGLEGLSRLTRDSHKDFGIVLHHHGSRFRSEHAHLAEEGRAAGAQQVVSTVDLTLLEPDTYWLPSPFDLNELAATRASGLAARVLKGNTKSTRVAHAPTNRDFKGTELVIDAVKVLHSGGLPIELDLIERTPYEETLRRKAQADIFIDQVGAYAQGYGNNAVEAWGMGIPVISQVVDPAVRKHMVQLWGDLPFVEPTSPTPYDLAAIIGLLATDDSLRAQWGLRGSAFVHTYHDEKTVSDVLAEHYRAVVRS